LDKAFQNNTVLIEHLIKGNEKAYIYLIKSYHKTLFVYALSLCNDHDMSEDIVQNVLMRTWEFRENLKTNHSIKGFLYKSIYNEFINLYHRNQSISALEKVYVEALNEIIDNKNTDSLKKKIDLISEEIENLPTKCKQTFLLSKKDGLTNMEIAEYLDISIKSVEAHITKAYAIIRKKVGAKIYNILFLLFGHRKRIRI